MAMIFLEARGCGKTPVPLLSPPATENSYEAAERAGVGVSSFWFRCRKSISGWNMLSVP